MRDYGQFRVEVELGCFYFGSPERTYNVWIYDPESVFDQKRSAPVRHVLSVNIPEAQGNTAWLDPDYNWYFTVLEALDNYMGRIVIASDRESARAYLDRLKNDPDDALRTRIEKAHSMKRLPELEKILAATQEKIRVCRLYTDVPAAEKV